MRNLHVKIHTWFFKAVKAFIEAIYSSSALRSLGYKATCLVCLQLSTMFRSETHTAVQPNLLKSHPAGLLYIAAMYDFIQALRLESTCRCTCVCVCMHGS